MGFLIDPIGVIASRLSGLISGWGASAVLTNVIVTTIGVASTAIFALLTCIILIWLERKLSARFQDRYGPNRVGPFGLFQTVADIIKIFTKEDIVPAGADKVVYNIAPILSVSAVMLIWAVLPLADGWLGTTLSVGVLYIVAVGSLGILAVLMAGWSSNNKFALLGAFRTVAQMVSYEVPMVLSLMVPVLLARSMGVSDIVNAQNGVLNWFVWLSPVAVMLFFISSMAEMGRAPFDLIEAESELVAGFHTEYSGLKFGMFFVGEFIHVFTFSAMISTLFFGGWHGPGAETYPILGFFYLMIKTYFMFAVVNWIRMSLPRVRIDQMLNMNWKFFTPLALALVVMTAIAEKTLQVYDASQFVRIFVLFALNLLLGWAALTWVDKVIESKGRTPVGAPRPVARPPVVETVSAE